MRYGATHRGFESLPLRHRPRRATEAATRGPRRPRGGGLVDRAGRGCPPPIDLRPRVPAQDRRGASLAGEPDRRPSRPVVSPIYAQGSYYGTNRVVASAPGHLTSPAAPLLSTERAAQPPGRDRRRSRCSVARTGRVSRKNRTRGRGDGVRHSPAQRRRPSRAPCYDPVAVLGGELAVPCTCNPL